VCDYLFLVPGGLEGVAADYISSRLGVPREAIVILPREDSGWAGGGKLVVSVNAAQVSIDRLRALGLTPLYAYVLATSGVPIRDRRHASHQIQRVLHEAVPAMEKALVTWAEWQGAVQGDQTVWERIRDRSLKMRGCCVRSGRHKYDAMAVIRMMNRALANEGWSVELHDAECTLVGFLDGSRLTIAIPFAPMSSSPSSLRREEVPYRAVSMHFQFHDLHRSLAVLMAHLALDGVRSGAVVMDPVSSSGTLAIEAAAMAPNVTVLCSHPRPMGSVLTRANSLKAKRMGHFSEGSRVEVVGAFPPVPLPPHLLDAIVMCLAPSEESEEFRHAGDAIGFLADFCSREAIRLLRPGGRLVCALRDCRNPYPVLSALNVTAADRITVTEGPAIVRPRPTTLPSCRQQPSVGVSQRPFPSSVRRQPGWGGGGVVGSGGLLRDTGLSRRPTVVAASPDNDGLEHHSVLDSQMQQHGEGGGEGGDMWASATVYRVLCRNDRYRLFVLTKRGGHDEADRTEEEDGSASRRTELSRLLESIIDGRWADAPELEDNDHGHDDDEDASDAAEDGRVSALPMRALHRWPVRRRLRTAFDQGWQAVRQ